MAISRVVISLSLVVGIALGQWFKVLILVPVMSLALAGTIAADIARGEHVWSIALMAIAVMTRAADWVPDRYLAAVLHRCRQGFSSIPRLGAELGSVAASID